MSEIENKLVGKRFSPYLKYRDSGVEWLGDIPKHWEVTKLGFISVSSQTGPFGSQLHAMEYVDNGIPVINPSNIQNGQIVPDQKCTVEGDVYLRLCRHKLKEGDIILARRGEMGRCALVTKPAEGWIYGTGSLRIRLDKGKSVPEYISIFLSLAGIRDHLLLESVGSTMDNLNTNILSRIPIVCPPISEQMKLVKFVGREACQIDRLATKVQEAIKKLREYRTALISAAVTGKIDVRGVAA